MRWKNHPSNKSEKYSIEVARAEEILSVREGNEYTWFRVFEQHFKDIPGEPNIIKRAVDIDKCTKGANK